MAVPTGQNSKGFPASGRTSLGPNRDAVQLADYNQTTT